MPHHYYITGFMGSGKTTIGQALAKQLHYQVIDTDQWIEEKEQQSVRELFQTKGEAYFRKQETIALESISGTNIIVTTGGGIVENEYNRQLMKKQGVIIYLKCELNELLKRLEGDKSRPLLQSKEKVEKLFHSRQAYYEEADFIIDTTLKTVQQVVDEIKALLKS